MTEKNEEKKIEKKEKTVETCKASFDSWKEKNDKKLLKLFLEREKAAEGTLKNKDPNDIAKQITALRTKISQKESSTYKEIAQLIIKSQKAGSSSDAKEERRKRTHHLCTLGGLIEKAGLGNLAPGILLGMLLQQAAYMKEHPDIVNRWKVKGDEALKQESEEVTETSKMDS